MAAENHAADLQQLADIAVFQPQAAEDFEIGHAAQQPAARLQHAMDFGEALRQLVAAQMFKDMAGIHYINGSIPEHAKIGRIGDDVDMRPRQQRSGFSSRAGAGHRRYAARSASPIQASTMKERSTAMPSIRVAGRSGR